MAQVLPQLSVSKVRAHLRVLCDWTLLGGQVQVMQRDKLVGLLCSAKLIHPGSPAATLPLPEARADWKATLNGMGEDGAVLLTLRGRPHAALLGPARAKHLEPPAHLLPLPDLDSAAPLLASPPLLRAAAASLSEEVNMPKTTVVTYWNEAGGASKTSLVAETGYLLSRRLKPDGQPYRVLLIDLDPQRSLTHRMGLVDGLKDGVRLGQTSYLVMQAQGEDFPEPMHPVRMPELSVIPAHQQMRVLDGLLLSDDRMLELFSVALKQCAGDYDYVLVDTPPSNGGLTRAALVASDYAVIPCTTHLKSTENIENVTAVLGQCRKLNPNLKLALFMPTAYNKQRVHDREIMARLTGEFSRLAPIASPITERPAIFRDVLVTRGAIGLDFPLNPAVQELELLVTELLMHTGGEAVTPAAGASAEIRA